MTPPDPRAGDRAVFVLGLQRSGTTWVANMLHGSGAVAAIAAEDHRGVHESLFFSHFAQAFGPFSDPVGRQAFRDAFAASDYWILSDLEDSALDGMMDRSHDHADFFEKMMDTVADRAGTPLWLEKSPHHTLLAGDIARRYPAAHFVCVVRDSRTLILSRLSAYGRTPSGGVKRMADILRGALANALYTRHLRRFASNSSRAHLLHYDKLAADPRAGRTALVRALDLPISPDALVSRFAPNTSHDRGAATPQLSLSDRCAVAIGDGLGRVLPLGVLDRIERKRRTARGFDWPDWVWRRSGFEPGGDSLELGPDPEHDDRNRDDKQARGA